MVSPHRRREAVCTLQRRLEISERRACEIVGQHRSTQRYVPKRPDDDAALRRELRTISSTHKRWGYRRAHGHLVNEKGWRVNRKRVQRIWRSEGLRVPPKARKRRRAGASGEEPPARAEHPGHVWALDFQHDATVAGVELRFLNVVDEFTREALAIRVSRSFTADQTVEVLGALARERGFPAFVRMDNGPELTAAALQGWCESSEVETTYIDPGCPWQNPWVESLNGRFRDEVLDCELFTDVADAQLVADEWRETYNSLHPHSALGMLAPAVFAQSWRAEQGAAVPV